MLLEKYLFRDLADLQAFLTGANNGSQATALCCPGVAMRGAVCACYPRIPQAHIINGAGNDRMPNCEDLLGRRVNSAAQCAMSR